MNFFDLPLPSALEPNRKMDNRPPKLAGQPAKPASSSELQTRPSIPTSWVGSRPHAGLQRSSSSSDMSSQFVSRPSEATQAPETKARTLLEQVQKSHLPSSERRVPQYSSSLTQTTLQLSLAPALSSSGRALPMDAANVARAKSLRRKQVIVEPPAG